MMAEQAVSWLLYAATAICCFISQLARVLIMICHAALPILQLRASLGLQPFTSQLPAPASSGGLQLPPLEVTHFLVADSADFLAVQFNTAGGGRVGRRVGLNGRAETCPDAG
jgi:hypothetical protein